MFHWDELNTALGSFHTEMSSTLGDTAANQDNLCPCKNIVMKVDIRMKITMIDAAAAADDDDDDEDCPPLQSAVRQAVFDGFPDGLPDLTPLGVKLSLEVGIIIFIITIVIL